MAPARPEVLESHAGDRELAAADADAIRLDVIDELWADYLAAAAELRSGTAWVAWGYGYPYAHYLGEIHRMFGELEATIESETVARLATPAASDRLPRRRGATWTYLTPAEPFGGMTRR